MKQERQVRYSTSEVMKRFSVGRNALRLYEEMGLLRDLPRSESGYREYMVKHLEVLKFVLEAKQAGFTLKEIGSLLDALRAEEKITCGEISEEITDKVSAIDAEISVLEKKKAFLSDFLSTCSSQEPAQACDVVGKGLNRKACCK